MPRRMMMSIGFLVIALALPLSASQFVKLPFDQVAREATYVVRGTVENTWSAWDDAHEVIFTYATVRVNRYFGETTGPDTLVVREVGGTVGNYTQEAIGFPAIRNGEDVVLFLSRWEDAPELRIHAYNQGKFLVRNRDGVDVLIEDSVKQGEDGINRGARPSIRTESVDVPAFRMDEFAQMVDAARAGARVDIDRTRIQ
ncbi:MAG TPA: hypothetical protein VF824_07080 [Thermoanaerobaculia bacterium]